MIVKVLSLWQPWASFIVWGLKKWETRTRDTSYRGTFCVHASKDDKGKKNPGRHLCETDPFFIKAMADKGLTFNDLPFGAIIGQAGITSVYKTQFISNLWKEGQHPEGFHVKQEIAFGDYSQGRKAWGLTNPIEYNPIIKNVAGRVYPFWEYDLPEPYGSRVKFKDGALGTIAGIDQFADRMKTLIQNDTGGRGHWIKEAFDFL